MFRNAKRDYYTTVFNRDSGFGNLASGKIARNKNCESRVRSFTVGDYLGFSH